MLAVLVGLNWGALCHTRGPLTWSPGAVAGPGLREWQSPRKDLEVLTCHLKVTLRVELLSAWLKEALKGEEGPLSRQWTPRHFLRASWRACCRFHWLPPAQKTQLLCKRDNFQVMAGSPWLCGSSGQRSQPAGNLLSHHQTVRLDMRPGPWLPPGLLSACRPSEGESHRVWEGRYGASARSYLGNC